MLRARPDLFSGLPPRSALVRQGNALRRLGDEPFDIVVNEIVPPAQVAIAAGFGREVQTDMFGALDMAESYIVERAKVRSGAVRKLAREERVFKLVNAEASRIRDAGNVLQESENARRARVAAQAEELLDRLADRKGPVGDALGAAARRARADGRTGPAIDDFVGALRSVIEGDDRAWLEAGRAGDAGRAGPEDGSLPVAAEPPPAVAAPAARLPDDATLSLFDQPVGPGQAAAADELAADLARTPSEPETAELLRAADAENAADTDFLAQLDRASGSLKPGAA